MKRFLLTLIVVSCLVPEFAVAQSVPGYLGKRFSVEYNLFTFLSWANPASSKIKTDEQLAIAQDCMQVLKNKGVNPVPTIPIAVSGRHIHLTQAVVDQLFGRGYQLSKRANLGRLMGIKIDAKNKVYVGASDSSSPDGGAVGY